MGHIFINVNSSGSPPTWTRGQTVQKHLVLDMASQAAAAPPQEFNMLADPLPPISLSPASTFVSSMDDASSALPPIMEPGNIRGLVEMFLDVYIKRFGPNKTPTDPLTAGNECGGWRLLLPGWLGHSAVLDTAIAGMTAYFIGTQYQNASLSNHGSNKYLHALRMIQEALAKLELSGRRYLLATTLVMSSTELFMSNGGGPSQIAHIKGATRLLNLSLDTSDIDELYVYILNQGLFEAISSRQPYTFSSPSFRHFIHNIYSVPRMNRNDLYFQWCECVLPLPNILSTTDSIISSSPRTPESVVLAVLDELIAIEQSIVPWYELLQSSGTGPLPSPAAQASTHSIASPLQFVSIEGCTNYCLYWISQLLILEARQMLYTKLPTTHGSSPEVLELRMSEYASLVCRSVQYCTHNTSFATTENMFLPLDILSGYFMRRGDESRIGWCLEAFARISREQKIVYVPEKFKLASKRAVLNVYDTAGIWDHI